MDAYDAAILAQIEEIQRDEQADNLVLQDHLLALKMYEDINHTRPNRPAPYAHHIAPSKPTIKPSFSRPLERSYSEMPKASTLGVKSNPREYLDIKPSSSPKDVSTTPLKVDLIAPEHRPSSLKVTAPTFVPKPILDVAKQPAAAPIQKLRDFIEANRQHLPATRDKLCNSLIYSFQGLRDVPIPQRRPMAESYIAELVALRILPDTYL